MILFYLIFFFLILRFTITLFNFISNPKLTHVPKKYHDLVSILIYAGERDQGAIRLIESILQQDYENFEVIIFDDQSRQSLIEFSETDSRFKIIKSEKTPEGWLRKNFASYQLAQMANGDYFMFLNDDTTITNGLINNTIHRMKMNKLALLSLFPNQLMISFGERIVVPLMNFILLTLLPLRLVQLSKNTVFAASSQDFMLFEADNYRRQQWHKQVRNKVAEDIKIMRLIKDAGYTTEALLANGYVTSRMYKNFNEASSGFGKILLAGFNNNIAGLLIYLVLVILGPIYVWYYLSWGLLFFAFSLIILTKIMTSLSSGQNIFVNIILHPLQILSLLFISILSVKWYIEKNKENTIKR